MILQALYQYYQRKAQDPESNIAPPGLEWKEIPFLIVINRDGEFQYLEHTAEGTGKAARIKRFLVAKGLGRSGSASWQKVNLLWDHFGYVLAHPKTPKTKESVNPEKYTEELKKATADAAKQNGSFRAKVLECVNRFPNNEALQAVALFYAYADSLEKVQADPLFAEMTKKDGANLSFKLLGETHIVAEEPILRSLATANDATIATCLITGELGPIAKLHTATPVLGCKSIASLINFNSGAFCSYNKTQGGNAPVSTVAEDAYSTALKTLQGKDSRNKYMLNDTTVLFWAQEACAFEEDFACFFSAAPKDDPDRNVAAVRNLLQGVYSGKLSTADDTPFYVLGLAPNAARISVRYWREGTVGQYASNLKQHFTDLEIQGGAKEEKPYYSIFNLLAQVAFQYKVDNLPPNMVGDLTQAVLDNRPYPATLQLHCLNRIRADRSLSRVRVAILKAYLNRKNRVINYEKPQEITMALDRENQNQAYLCGRLFAILERIQEAAQPGLNATIRDRYYGAASTTPTTVFARLLTLSNHHLSKIGGGLAVNYSKEIQEIVGNISANGFPAHLSLDDQSRFSIGYYHQRQDSFTKKSDKE